MTVDQHQDLAAEVAPLSVARGAANVERGLARRPFAQEADGVLGQDVGHGFRRGMQDLLFVDHLNGAGEAAARFQP
jgi:hypothetical protein